MLPLPPVPTQSETGSTQWLDYYFRLNKFTQLLGIGPYITNDDTKTTTVYPTWVTGSDDNLPVTISKTKLTFIPSTGIFSSTGFDGTIGTVTKRTGAFTTGTFTGQITSTVTTGTSPFILSSSTVVPNLNASLLLGQTWNSPGNIGQVVAAAGRFTTLTTTSTATFAGAFGCNGATAQPGYSIGGSVVSTPSTNIAPYGYTTAAQADDILTKLNRIIAALFANGILV